MKIKKLTATAIIPTRGTAGAAGFDLYADSVEGEYRMEGEEVICAGGSQVTVHTGIAMAIPHGYVGLVFPRSGLATKKGLRLSNCVGVIDEDYRGEIIVKMYQDCDFNKLSKASDVHTLSSDEVADNTISFTLHDRVAQIVFVKYDAFDLEVVDELDETERGEGGFGHTGSK